MTDQEQIDALKAQVNYLREVLDGLAKLGNGERYVNSIAARALEFTPEQCLAEVKARAIEEYKQHNTPKQVNGLSVDTWKRMFKVC